MPITMFIIFSLVILQRLSELFLSNRNTKRLLSEGFKEYSPGHYPLIVLLHLTWILAMLFELDPKVELNFVLLGIYLVLQILRYYIIFTLGKYWTTRIIRNPNVPLVQRGLYRYIRHPNYLVVTLEMFILPMVFGMFQVSLIFGTLNILVLIMRIYFENKALNLTDGPTKAPSQTRDQE